MQQRRSISLSSAAEVEDEQEARAARSKLLLSISPQLLATGERAEDEYSRL
jgi:hypothetical protein